MSTFALSLLILPFSNAEVETLFSWTGLIKGKLRNKMKPDLLISIVRVREMFKLCCFTAKISDEIVEQIGSSEKYQKEIEYEDDEEITLILNAFQI